MSMMPKYRTPEVDQAIKAASAQGFAAEFHTDHLLSMIRVRVRDITNGFEVRQSFTDMEVERSNSPVILCFIEDAIKELKMKRNGEKEEFEQRKWSQMEAELQKYKDAVKQLAFELEMAQSNSRGADTALRVAEIRRAALEQASDYVMDFGVPKSGAELERLCNEIKGLKETKDMAMSRAAAAMNKFFTNAAEVPF